MKTIGIAGWKNSGKTTLVAALVSEFSARGLRVGTIKHAHHAFDIDHAGTDSFRHRAAGAAKIAIVSDRRVATIEELGEREPPSLDAVLAAMADCDLVLIEGYKTGEHPKIETRRLQARDLQPLVVPNVIAIAADHPVEGATVPVFALDDVTAIAAFIITALAIRLKPSASG